MEARLKLRIAIGGMTAFVLDMVLLHALNRADMPWHMSTFVFQDPWLWSAGILALAAALAALASTLPQLDRDDKDVRLASRLLTVAAALLVLLVIFPTDDAAWPYTATGYIHVLSAISSIALQGGVMLILVDAGRRNPHVGEVTGRSFLWPALAGAVGFLWGFSDGLNWPISPVVQRFVALIMVGWLLSVALRAQAALGSDPVAATDGTAASR